jgi:hypothetical protein
MPVALAWCYGFAEASEAENARNRGLSNVTHVGYLTTHHILQTSRFKWPCTALSQIENISHELNNTIVCKNCKLDAQQCASLG